MALGLPGNLGRLWGKPSNLPDSVMGLDTSWLTRSPPGTPRPLTTRVSPPPQVFPTGEQTDEYESLLLAEAGGQGEPDSRPGFKPKNERERLESAGG